MDPIKVRFKTNMQDYENDYLDIIRAFYPHIVLSDDNEGNGYHGMFFGFAKCTKDYRDIISDSQYRSEKDTIVLG